MAHESLSQMVNRWLGLGSSVIDVRPHERALLVPTLPADHPDALAELEAILEARRILAGRPLAEERAARSVPASSRGRATSCCVALVRDARDRVTALRRRPGSTR